MARASSCCLISSSRIIHFVIKPVKGGKPDRDIKIAKVTIKKDGFVGKYIIIVLMLLAFIESNKRNAPDVIMM